MDAVAVVTVHVTFFGLVAVMLVTIATNSITVILFSETVERLVSAVVVPPSVEVSRGLPELIPVSG
jgi:peroxiredoxin family protein